MPVAVNVTVKDKEPQPAAVENVRVSIFDSPADDYQTSVLTDDNGLATLALAGAVDPGTTYRVRFFKTGVDFSGVKLIKVIEPADPDKPNDFDETGEINVRPTAADPNYCRCSGYFVLANGNVRKDEFVMLVSPLDIEHSSESWPGDPTGIGGRTVVHKDVEVRSDGNGFAEIDLPRNGKFTAQLVGMGDRLASIVVPDVASVDFLDLLYPVPAALTFLPAPANVAVDAKLEITAELTLSSNSPALSLSDLDYTLDNASVLKIVSVKDLKITVEGLLAGVATITFTIKEGVFPQRLPKPTLSGAALVVTVP